jgi:hypothetical protein
MASTTETGHARNVANFQNLVNAVANMGDAYKPTNDLIKLPALQKKLASSQAANSAVKDPLAQYNRVVSERAGLFQPLNGRTTQLLAIFQGTDALQQVKDFAKTTANKIRGSKGKAKQEAPPPPADEDPNAPPSEVKEEGNHSVSQRSFVMQTDNFETFIGILAAEPSYKPAEENLQVATLQALLASMKAHNNSVDISFKALKKVRTVRNTEFYTAKTGLVDVALAVKNYTKGAFSTKDERYKGIKGLKFARLAKDPNA